MSGILIFVMVFSATATSQTKKVAKNSRKRRIGEVIDSSQQVLLSVSTDSLLI